MATTFSISTGGLTSSITVNDDQKAQRVLNLAASAMGIEGDTPQKRLDGILLSLVRQLQNAARDHDYHSRVKTAVANVDADNQLVGK